MRLVYILATILSSSALADLSIPTVCESAGPFGALEILKGNPQSLLDPLSKRDWDGAAKEIARGCDSSTPASYCGDNLGTIVWTLHMFTDAAAGRLAYDIQTNRIGARFHSYFHPESAADFSFDAELDRAIANPIVEYTLDEIAVTRGKLEAMKSNPQNPDGEIADLKAKAPLVCAAHGLGRLAAGCTAGLRELADRMHPRMLGGYSYGMIDLYDELLTDSRFAQALPKLAQKIRARIRTGDPTAKDSALESDYLADTVTSFSEIGLSAEEARAYAWKWMAIYATRGASFSNFYLLLNEKQLGLAYSILTIASGVSALDQIRYRTAPAYTLPGMFKTACYYGKPYHFWMNAYFTRELMHEGYRASAASLASYLTGALYEFGSDTLGRDPKRALTEPVGSLYYLWLKTNLFFDAMGARFGRESVTPKIAVPTATDPLLAKFFTNALPTEKMPPEIEKVLIEKRATSYLVWNLKFQPYPLLDAFGRL